jgi:hypothetical protein
LVIFNKYTKTEGKMEKTQELILAQESLPAQQAQAPMVALIDKLCQMPDLPVEKMQQVLDMFERQQQAEARQAFNHAFSAAKGEIPKLIKTGTAKFPTKNGGVMTYKFEKLPEIAEIINPILSNHGLSYRYAVKQNGKTLFVTCILSHKDGYQIEATLSCEEDYSGMKNNVQAIGSALTYLQRYTLKAVLGVSASDDDDGAGIKKTNKTTQAGQAQLAPLETLTREEANEINNLVEKSGTDEAAMLAHYCVEAVELLLRKDFLPLKKRLTERVAEKQGVAT